MRLSIRFAVVFVAIAFVQSIPIFNGVNDLNAALTQLASQSNLNNQLNDLSAQVTNALSSAQLQTLAQQVLQLAQNVMNGNIDANGAVNQLSGELQQYLGSNPQLLNAIQILLQQLTNAAMTLPPNLISSFGTRSASTKQLQISDLQAILAQYPQYSSSVNQIAALADQIVLALSQSQLQTLEQLVLSLAQNVMSGNLDANTGASQLLAQVQQYLGSNTQLFNAVSNAVLQLVNLGAGY